MFSSFLMTVGVPIVALVVNTMVRWALKLPHSAPSDFIFVLMVIDLSVVIQPGIIEAALPELAVREVYAVIMLVCFALWIVAMARVEKPLARPYIKTTTRLGAYPIGLMFAYYAVSGSAMVVNLAPIYWASPSDGG
jgi:hypothetical protein